MNKSCGSSERAMINIHLFLSNLEEQNFEDTINGQCDFVHNKNAFVLGQHGFGWAEILTK